MAYQTSKKLRNMVMYQVFVRNFSEEGTFSEVRKELDRIKSLGADIIWLMPIHPVGKVKRKGSLGSPYAISDYRAINPEFGTMDDFVALVEDIHAHGMKCIIDVVYNHTSPDSVLSCEHPEWFYHREDGSFGNRVGDWTDIIDLDYSDRGLWRYLIDTLKMWAKIVDGFRCDVAPLIPSAFWEEAHREVEEVREGCIWLCESVEPGFITYMRSRSMNALSDSELYRSFDICYDYDIYEDFRDYLFGKGSLESYAQAICSQEYTYPDNYVKMRFLENHDQPRAAFLIPDPIALRNWTAFMYFQKGLALIYAGQEFSLTHTPTLFDKDTIQRESGEDISPLLTKLSQIKRCPIFTDSTYSVTAANKSFISALHISSQGRAAGIFSLSGEAGILKVDMPDGVYENLIDGKEVEVAWGFISSRGEPIIITTDN